MTSPGCPGLRQRSRRPQKGRLKQCWSAKPNDPHATYNNSIFVQQRSQPGEVLHILMAVFRLRGFQTAGQMPETPIRDDMAERLEPDSPSADARMTINSRCEIGFRVVQVKSQDLL